MDLNSKYIDVKQLDLSKYDLIKQEKLEDLNSMGILLKHKKSGARVVVISNDDENKVFSIGFKTPPYNDTGLQHILEHSTLCGSRKYPVKDPFVELCRGSLNTFLNAMTYPDKTVYPVASCNDADFKNIIDVYMDAVFYPNIYEKPQIFQQEGWHYELEDKEDDVIFNGVVFNEMKGVYSSPDDVLSRYSFVSLFPDTAYRYESGGDPESIPQLSYEEFLNYHKNFYHPVNSYIYIYGDMDVQERLDYLDQEYLKDFDKNEVSIDSDIALQKPFSKVVEAVYPYPITEDEALTENTFLSMNKVIKTSLDPKIYLAMQILDYALIMAPGAKLKQTLVDRGIGTDIYSSYESSVYQPVYSIIAKNTELSKKQEFVDTIQEVLEDIVKNGIDQKMIAAGINFYEFKYREADYGAYPKGLMYYLTMMDSWLYDENEPFMHLEAGQTFEWLKQQAKEGLFEQIIQTYLLENNHGSVICLVPEHGLEEQKAEKEKALLEKYRASLNEEQIEQLIKQSKELKEYQDEPSSQEDLESIKMLSLGDLNTTPLPLLNEKKEVSGIDVIQHDMFTNDISYMMLAFNCNKVPDELLPYVGLLTSVLGLMGTQNYTYPELTNEININCGGITTDAVIYTDNKQVDEYTIMYEVKGKAFFDKQEFVLTMMEEILLRTKFDDDKRMKELIARIKSRLESSMLSSGHTVAMLSAMAQFSPSGYYSSQMRGYGFYKLIQKLDQNFDSMKNTIYENLQKLIELIFTRDNLIVSLNANQEGFEQFEQPMKTFVSQLPNEQHPLVQREFHSENIKKGYTSSSQVQYVARCGNFVRDGYRYTGALKLLKVIFSYDYLWTQVRVKGGAYGCMSGFYRNGDVYMVSYRDPNLEKTNQIFEEAPDYLKNFEVSDRDMLKYIIGTIGEMDNPLNPAAKGLRSFGAYLCHTTIEDLQRERNEVLYANADTIRALAPIVESAIKQNYLCVVGNQKTINEQAGLFDVIQPLYIS